MLNDKNQIEKTLRILVFSDLHSYDRRDLEQLRNYNDYDCCVLLGDIPPQALNLIRDISNSTIFGILGNHDEPNQLERCDIINLNGRTITVNGVTFSGISGSHRYKNGNYVMLSQKESIIAAKELQPAEILISHDTAYRVMGRTDNAHCGLKGISKYIARNKIKINLCGHYHQNIKQKYKACTIRCVYGCSLINICQTTTRKWIIGEEKQLF